MFVSSLAGCMIRQTRKPADLIRFGVSLAEKGYWNEAAYYWRIVLDQDPENVAALNNLGVAAEVEECPDRARTLIGEALNLRPDSRLIRKNLQAMDRRKHDETTRKEEDPRKRKFSRGGDER